MKGTSRSNYMPNENNRMSAKPKATKKAATAPKTLLPKGFKDERQLADAIAKAKAKATSTPKPKVKVAPMPTLSAQQKQDKALADLMKKREAEAKKTGSWPNYYTN